LNEKDVKDVRQYQLNINFNNFTNQIEDIDKPAFSLEIQKVITFINNNPKTKIEIGVHTDVHGDKLFNKRMSISQAKSILDFIKNLGANTDSVSAFGYGECMPLYDIETIELLSSYEEKIKLCSKNCRIILTTNPQLMKTDTFPEDRFEIKHNKKFNFKLDIDSLGNKDSLLLSLNSEGEISIKSIGDCNITFHVNTKNIPEKMNYGMYKIFVLPQEFDCNKKYYFFEWDKTSFSSNENHKI
jgi:hypothetical protein